MNTFLFCQYDKETLVELLMVSNISSNYTAINDLSVMIESCVLSMHVLVRFPTICPSDFCSVTCLSWIYSRVSYPEQKPDNQKCVRALRLVLPGSSCRTDSMVFCHWMTLVSISESQNTVQKLKAIDFHLLHLAISVAHAIELFFHDPLGL